VNRKVAASMFLVGAATAWAVVSFSGGFTLTVDGGGRSLRFPLPGDEFSLSWTHSVELTEWRDTYTVAPGGAIFLTASTFASAGAGLPDRLGDGEAYRLEDGAMRIEGRRVPVGDLRMRLSAPSPHFLRVGGRVIDLVSIFGEGVVTIRVKAE
jgi:hypothetical protein